MKSFVAAAVTLALASGAAARRFTVYNNCPFTIWYVSSLFTVMMHVLTVPQACCMSHTSAYMDTFLISSIPQIFTDLHVGSARPNQPTGCVLMSKMCSPTSLTDRAYTQLGSKCLPGGVVRRAGQLESWPDLGMQCMISPKVYRTNDYCY